jgi:hypothetical protein
MGSIPVPSAKYDNQLWRGNPIAGDGTRLESGRSVKTLAGSTPVPSANFWKIKPTAGDGTGFESRRGESPYEFDPRIFRQLRPRNPTTLNFNTTTEDCPSPVYGACFESRCGASRRGFESLILRQMQV